MSKNYYFYSTPFIGINSFLKICSNGFKFSTNNFYCQSLFCIFIVWRAIGWIFRILLNTFLLHLFIIISNQLPINATTLMLSFIFNANFNANKSCISSSVKKNFLPFWFKAFQFKNKLCFSTTYFIFFQKNSWYSKWEKYLSQQCFHLCRNVAFSFRHKWKQSLKWITKKELQIWISISNYFKNRKTMLFYVLRLNFSVKTKSKTLFLILLFNLSKKNKQTKWHFRYNDSHPIFLGCIIQIFAHQVFIIRFLWIRYFTQSDQLNHTGCIIKIV